MIVETFRRVEEKVLQQLRMKQTFAETLLIEEGNLFPKNNRGERHFFNSELEFNRFVSFFIHVFSCSCGKISLFHFFFLFFLSIGFN